MTEHGPLRRRGAVGDDPARAPRRRAVVGPSLSRSTSRRSPLGQSQPNTEIFRRIAAVMGLDHPASQDLTRRSRHLPDGYDPADVDQLWERGWVKIRPEEDPAEGHASLGGDAPLGQDPVPDAHDAPPDDDQLVVLTRSPTTSSTPPASTTPACGPWPAVPACCSPLDAAARDVADGELVGAQQRHRHHDGHRAAGEVLAGTAVLISNWWNEDFPGGRGTNAHRPDAHRRRRGAASQVRVRVTPVRAWRCRTRC